jgi:hypothetical protein
MQHGRGAKVALVVVPARRKVAGAVLQKQEEANSWKLLAEGYR